MLSLGISSCSIHFCLTTMFLSCSQKHTSLKVLWLPLGSSLPASLVACAQITPCCCDLAKKETHNLITHHWKAQITIKQSLSISCSQPYPSSPHIGRFGEQRLSFRLLTREKPAAEFSAGHQSPWNEDVQSWGTDLGLQIYGSLLFNSQKTIWQRWQRLHGSMWWQASFQSRAEQLFHYKVLRGLQSEDMTSHSNLVVNTDVLRMPYSHWVLQTLIEVTLTPAKKGEKSL